MNTNFQKSAALAGMLILAAGASASPLFKNTIGSNITISDNNYYGTGWYSNREDQETESTPDTVTSQAWDLEGMFVKGTELTMVGGYDFKNGVKWTDGHTYRSGDIFIDVTGDAQYGKAANGGSGATAYGSGPHTAVTTNAFGYDYVMHLDYATMTYDVFKLTPQSLVTRVMDVASSNPWQYYGGGIPVEGYQNVSFDYIAGLTNTDTGFLGDSSNTTAWSTHTNDKHYALQTDISFLAPGSTATFHYTMECGNDNLMGRTKIVPDTGSTLVLALGAVAGLFGLRRKLLA